MASGNITITLDAGRLTGTTIAAGSIAIGTIKAQGVKFVTTPEPPPPCNVRRGGPRSKVFCEVYSCVPHDLHCGRGNSGSWYSWKDNNGIRD